MVGVTGSIPVAPTTETKEIRHIFDVPPVASRQDATERGRNRQPRGHRLDTLVRSTFRAIGGTIEGMAEPPEIKKWRPRASPIAIAFRGEPARFKPYFQVRVEDLTQGRRRAFGSCIICRRFAPIHPYYINFQFGRPRRPSSFIVDLAKRLRCTGCGNDLENVIIVEAAPDEDAAPRR